MPECHTCPYNNRRSNRCLKCSGTLYTPRNSRLMPLDDISPADLSRLAMPRPEPEHPASTFVRYWAKLPTTSRELITRFPLSGSYNLAVAARDLHISRQAAKLRRAKTIALFPELRDALSPRKRRQRRKPDRPAL